MTLYLFGYKIRFTEIFEPRYKILRFPEQTWVMFWYYWIVLKKVKNEPTRTMGKRNQSGGG